MSPTQEVTIVKSTFGRQKDNFTRNFSNRPELSIIHIQGNFGMQRGNFDKESEVSIIQSNFGMQSGNFSNFPEVNSNQNYFRMQNDNYAPQFRPFTNYETQFPSWQSFSNQDDLKVEVSQILPNMRYIHFCLLGNLKNLDKWQF